MLGFGPISSSSISGDGFKLISIPLALAATATITFGGNPTLRVAGKALKFSAVPIQYSFRAEPESLHFKAIPERFKARGVR